MKEHIQISEVFLETRVYCDSSLNPRILGAFGARSNQCLGLFRPTVASLLYAHYTTFIPLQQFI